MSTVLASVARLADEVIAPRAKKIDSECLFPRDNIDALGREGLLALIVPAQQGGLGESPTTFVKIVEIIGAACASTGMVYVMHNCAVSTLLAGLNPRVAEEFLKPIVAGAHLSTLAFSEAGTGAHFYASYGQASVANGNYLLSAEKSFVTSAGQADSYVVSTQAPGAAGPLQTALFIVKKETSGLTPAGQWQGLGMRANASAPLSITNCSVPADYLLCREGEGFQVMLNSVLPWFQIGAAAVYTGVARAALQAAVSHVKARSYQHTGSSLATLPTIQRAIGEMQVVVDRAHAFNLYAAAQMEQQSPTAMLALLEAKVVACDAAEEVTRQALQVCGGAAFAGRLSIERNLRDALAGSIMAPTTDILLDFVGKSALGIPLF